MWRYYEIRTLPDIVRYWASKSPEKVALVGGGASRTYAQLDARSNAIARKLQDRDLPPGSPIGFLGKNSVEFFEVWFAAGKVACPIAPFNWRSPENELLRLVDDARPPVIFVASEFLEVMRRVQARALANFDIVDFDPADRFNGALSCWIEGVATTPVQASLHSEDIALITYTSGTTGNPKGVQTSHDAFQYSFLSTSLDAETDVREGDIILMGMPNFHLGGSWLILNALYFGGAISIIPAFDPAALLDALSRDRPTILPMVPTAIQLILSMPEFSRADFSSIRRVIYFGSPIGADLLVLALERFRCELLQYYGTSETWIISALRHKQHLLQDPRWLASCGTPIPLVSMKIADESGAEVSPGTVGEILVRSPILFCGYFRQPAATAAAMSDGWYRTGDLGRRDEAGCYTIVDRAKDMIITGGENVYSAEVEAVMLKHPAVAQVAVIGTSDARWGERVTALVVLKLSVNVTVSELEQHCRTHLAGYKVPKSILFESSLPMTPTGKIVKPALRQRFRTATAGTPSN
jgi:acyl-CoA synthetase (AMP-forming)/AMP-acid ligase II